MKKLLSFFGAVLVWVAAAAAIYQWCIAPYRCNLAGKTVLARTENLAVADRLLIAPTARNNLDLIEHCFEIDCSNPELAMLLADNYRLLGKPDAAVAILEKELRYERRPEIYCLLGLSEIDAGRPREGVRDLTTAVIYNPTYLERISDYHDEVHDALVRYQIHIQEIAKAQGLKP